MRVLSTLRAQVAIAFGALVFATAAALSIGFAGLYERLALNDQGDDLQTLARSTAIVLADGIHDRLREIELLAAAPPYDYSSRANAAAWGPALENLKKGRPHYSWIGVADGTGKVLAATGGMLVGADVAARPWYQAARSHAHMGDVHDAKLLAAMLPPSVSGEPVRFIDFAAPIYDRGGELDGVLGAHATWDWVQDVINSLRSERARDRGILVFLLDREGKVIHRPVGIAAGVRPPADLRVQDSAVAQWSDGASYLTAAVRLPARDAKTDMGWTIVARQPLAIAKSAANESRNAFLVVGGTAALLAMLVAWWLAGRFSAPLVQIAAAAQRVEKGELAAEIPQNTASKELGQLGVALQRMKSSLIERDAALQSARDKLEERVIERTAELTSAQRKLEEANEVLSALALRDALTGLYNRLAADERLASEWARHRRTSTPFSVLLMDVDHFKKVNDTLGHAGGDDVLQGVAVALRTTCRASDLCARFGGEEFIVLMPDTTLEGARSAAEKIRGAVAGLDTLPTRVTISIGAASTQQGFDDVDALVAAADEALYRAKREGRNRVMAYEKESATT